MPDPVLTADTAPEDSRSWEDLAKIGVSVIVATILGAQVLIGFLYLGGQTFPIVAYPMYKQVHYEGERLNDYLVYVSADGGEEEVLGPDTIGISGWLYQQSITVPIIRGKQPPLGAGIAEEACATRNADSIRLAIYDSGFTIRRTGPVRDRKQLLGATTFDCRAF